MKTAVTRIVVFAVILGTAVTATAVADSIRVGSKNFTEGYVLAEVIAQTLEADGHTVERRFGLGGTLVCFEALRKGEIDVYPEYTGTITQAILEETAQLSNEELRERVADAYALRISSALGFNNTYAIALSADLQKELSLRTIGDLSQHPELRLAFSHEFINRNDGWPGLKTLYKLPHTPDGIEHGLAYQAIADNRIDVTDAYSTDGDIERYGLVTLEDDRGYFPSYLAVALYTEAIAPTIASSLETLSGAIDASTMRRMNAAVVVDGSSFAEAAQLLPALATTTSATSPRRWRTIARRTLRHLELTAIGLLAAMLVAIPLGIVAASSERLSRGLLYVTGALQTIPSIALLAFMIPLFGIGMLPAIVALFVYALLPIIRNTTTALVSVDPVVRKVAVGMGLRTGERLRYVELPLAAPTILAGVKTAAVINIGTATLAAFIGAGGLGEPIVTGLALNDTSLILEGAVPAAVLAIVTELAFELVERTVVPEHLRGDQHRAT